jgi:death-on-curing protein
MNYLGRDEVLDLHTFAIEHFGGRLGIRSQDTLLSAVHAPQQIMFGEELYPDLASKAAVLSFQILKNRPFVDGNEATALLVLLRFLAINHAMLDTTPPEALAETMDAVLHSNLDREGLTQWLRERIKISSSG